MKTIYLYYHWFCFFFQWLKVRTRMFVIGIDSIIWFTRRKHYLSIEEMKILLTWNSWKRYKKHCTYHIKKNNQLHMLPGNQIKEYVNRLY